MNLKICKMLKKYKTNMVYRINFQSHNQNIFEKDAKHCDILHWMEYSICGKTAYLHIIL